MPLSTTLITKFKAHMQYKPVQKYVPFFKKKRSQRNDKIEQRNKLNLAHKQLSNIIKNVYYFYIFINLYSLLTLYTSSDEQLIKSSAHIIIPILNSQVPFTFFLVSGITLIMTIFVYLVIRFEELGKIKATEKMPYIFNSEQRSTRQIATFITYILGPITVLMFVEKAYLFTSMDRLSAILAFFVFISFMSYRQRSKYQATLAIAGLTSMMIFFYLLIVPTTIRLFDTRADLVGANLNGVQIEKIRLSSAMFNHTRFSEATILDTTLENIEMWGSNFEKASIYNTKIINSMADYAKFNYSILRDVEFEDVNLKQSQFSEAVLFNVSFATSTKTRSSKLARDEVYQTDLSNSEFNQTIMVSVKFDNAILSNVNFYDTDLESVSFKNAVLNRTNFSTAKNLSCEKLQQARSTEKLIKPVYLHKCKL